MEVEGPDPTYFSVLRTITASSTSNFSEFHSRGLRENMCPISTAPPTSTITHSPNSTLPQPSLAFFAPHYLNHHSQSLLHTTSTITHCPHYLDHHSRERERVAPHYLNHHSTPHYLNHHSPPHYLNHHSPPQYLNHHSQLQNTSSIA